MEISSGGCSPRGISKKEGSEETTNLQLQELSHRVHEHVDFNLNSQVQSMNALDILRETVRILRFNSWGFMAITVVLICPVSAVILSNVLVDESIVKSLSIRLMLVAKTSGLPLRPLIKQSCHRFAEMAISSAVSFPLYPTLVLCSKAAVVYSVDCTYSRKKCDASKFCMIIAKFWRKIVSTYMWSCTVIVGCITLFCVFLVAFCSALSVLGFSPDVMVYAAVMVGLVFSVVFANAIIICDIAIVISVLEDVSGAQAMMRSNMLIKGQTQVGLLIFLGSTMGMAFVEGLFEHRVKTLSYGDGSSRLWEGPLLVVMYSFMVLIDSMMSVVFYFSCRSCRMEAADGESSSILEMAMSAETMAIQ
ncbi:hypothetical protein HN51_013776 [Arachis hypogaea]|uniref:Uncharacterized protein n=2 Tax=Arachis hypogaea TaxID=3818 RepID=A0A445DNS4_ARAHY|nr:uncharacterized protein LOC112734128 [Arachis hypogaea]QHO59585.1 uncharacterized protein DS421_3g100290 [Arachis hypogaea]RYR64815.1 hypothetical protein Ahy_A03g010856 isoform A [Arachis hypogaea]